MHALLVRAWAWIELDNAWNDMNPTMLVTMALYVVDYPIHWVLRLLIDNVQRTGTYLTATLVLGTLFWFAVGELLTLACRGIRRISVRRRPAAADSM